MLRLVALLAFAGVCALGLGQGACAEPFTAGERHLTTSAPGAALRNRGDPILRITVWYPAKASETDLYTGSASAPIFILGAVAEDAPFADDAKRPVVLLSHGLGGSARQLTWLGAALARHGYIAVAVDHPGANSLDGMTDVGAYAPWARAGDLTAALDAILLSRSDVAMHVAPGRVGVTGYALGAYAALLSAGARSRFADFTAFCDGPERDAMCGPQLEYPLDERQRHEVLARPALRELVTHEGADMRDPRVKSAFLIAPAFIQALAAPSLARIGVPVGMVLAGDDTIAPNVTNGEVVRRMVSAAKETVLPGVGHYDFLAECGPAGPQAVGQLCSEGPESKRAKVHQSAEAAAIEFFDTTLDAR